MTFSDLISCVGASIIKKLIYGPYSSSTSSFLLYTFVLTFAYNMTLLHLLTGNYIPILYGFFPFITLHDK